ncbi:MAG: elongation factor P [Kiritimatiellae bacterium]|jgi:elongation factor P|nr:elongation factor P [Kiritimatiellia bacterium]
MYSASDLRKGLRVEIDGVPYIITDFNFVKPGKGAAIYNCKMKNLLNGSTLSRSYRTNDKLDEPKLEERAVRFSYQDGENYIFVDKNFEQVGVAAEVLGDSRFFLTEDIEAEILIHNGRPIDVELPTFVEKEIKETEPGFRGNTATNVQKQAKIEGGYELQVPLFINQGDIVKIDTRTGGYADRVRATKVL